MATLGKLAIASVGLSLVSGCSSRLSSGPIASLRLKLFRRGVQDVDYLTLAAAADPVAVLDIVNAQLPKALWEYTVADPTSPNYTYNPISWSENPDDWESARSKLADIIEKGPTGPVATKLVFTSAPQSVLAGACSGAVTLQAQTASSSPTTLREAVSITLGPAASATFYSDPGCVTALPSSILTLAANASSATFYFKAPAAGTLTLTASMPVLSSTIQAETIH